MITRTEHPLIALRKIEDALRDLLSAEQSNIGNQNLAWTGLACRVDQINLLIDANEIQEIVPFKQLGKLTNIPQAKAWLKGLAQRRGQLLPILDFGLFLIGKPTAFTGRSRIVIGKAPFACGLILEEVSTLKHFSPKDKQPSKQILPGKIPRFITGSIQQNSLTYTILSLKNAAQDQELSNLTRDN